MASRVNPPTKTAGAGTGAVLPPITGCSSSQSPPAVCGGAPGASCAAPLSGLRRLALERVHAWRPVGTWRYAPRPVRWQAAGRQEGGKSPPRSPHWRLSARNRPGAPGRVPRTGARPHTRGERPAKSAPGAICLRSGSGHRRRHIDVLAAHGEHNLAGHKRLHQGSGGKQSRHRGRGADDLLEIIQQYQHPPVAQRKLYCFQQSLAGDFLNPECLGDGRHRPGLGPQSASS